MNKYNIDFFITHIYIYKYNEQFDTFKYGRIRIDSRR
jgi:hypothetical protein